jgi:hypothetical protein
MVGQQPLELFIMVRIHVPEHMGKEQFFNSREDQEKENIEELKRELVEMAMAKAKAETGKEEIFPAGTKESFEDCFTIEDGKILFWFNCVDKSTRLVKLSLARVDEEKSADQG